MNNIGIVYNKIFVIYFLFYTKLTHELKALFRVVNEFDVCFNYDIFEWLLI